MNKFLNYGTIIIDKSIEKIGLGDDTMYEGPVIYESHVPDYFLIGVLVVLGIFIVLLMLVSLSKIFQKADQKSWKAFIPIYHFLPLLEIVHLPQYYFVLMLLPIVQLFPFVMVGLNLSKSFKKDQKFAFGLVFLPFVFYPILAFSKIKYVGINEEKVEEVVIRDLIREKVETGNASMVLKTDQNISVGTNTVATSTAQNGILQADTSILEQHKPTVPEYIECPVCKNKVKKGAPVCFICGHKF